MLGIKHASAEDFSTTMIDPKLRSFLEKHFSTLPALLHTLSPNQIARFWESVQARSLPEWERLIQALSQASNRHLDALSWEEPLCWSIERLAQKGLSPSSLQRIGEAAFQNGEVAFLTVAGGLGTRLGFPGPKGLVPVTPLQQKTLFQVFAEKLQALQKRYHHPFHWLIMTSLQTDAATRKAFQEHHGYDPHYLHFFQQGTLPAFSTENTLLVDENGQIAELPDGHGGVFQALQKAQLLPFLQQEGIRTLSYFQVDNPLVHLDDALFLGAHLQQASDFSTKVVEKVHAEERVGLFVHINQQLQLVEYSEFPPAYVSARNSKGTLRYRWGNTAIHLLSMDFVQTCAKQPLPYHVCRKKVSAWDPALQNKQVIEGHKIEQFIFDVLPQARHPLLWEVQREEEFSPVKNAIGTDTLLTCQNDQIQRWLRWLKKTDPSWFASQNNTSLPTFEVSPLFADNETDFFHAWKYLAQKPHSLQGWYAHEN